MKKIFYLLLIALGTISCEREELKIVDTRLDYSLVEINNERLVIDIQSLDIENENFLITSFTPNTSCCVDGNFVTNNTVDASINGSLLGGTNVSVENSFQITLNNFSEGMNYYTIELDNGTYKKYFSFQFNLENTTVDYLVVIKNSTNDNVTNYEDAIFRFDIHTDSAIRILAETEAGISVFRERINNDSNEFNYITSVNSTSILKTSREKL